MMDLTKITTPFGLLDEATQEALKAHGGPYERYNGEAWIQADLNNDWPAVTYRVKPHPPKPREFWVLLNECGTLQAFARKADDTPPKRWRDFIGNGDAIIHAREVIE